MGAGKRFDSDDRSDPRRGTYSRAYCDERDWAIGRIETLRRNGMPLPALVDIARGLHRAAWEAEKRRARGDG